MLTGIAIGAYSILLKYIGIADNSSLILVQYLLVWIGIIISSYLLFKYYADIKLIEAFAHNARTLATILIVVLLTYSALYIAVSQKEFSWSVFNFMLMKVIFSFALSGLIASFVTSYFFHTFTPKK